MSSTSTVDEIHSLVVSKMLEAVGQTDLSPNVVSEETAKNRLENSLNVDVGLISINRGEHRPSGTNVSGMLFTFGISVSANASKTTSLLRAINNIYTYFDHLDLNLPYVASWDVTDVSADPKPKSDRVKYLITIQVEAACTFEHNPELDFTSGIQYTGPWPPNLYINGELVDSN